MLASRSAQRERRTHNETLIRFTINVFPMKSSNNYIDNSSDNLFDRNLYGKLDIEIKRKGMRRENPMCRHPYNRLCGDGPMEMGDGRLAVLKSDFRFQKVFFKKGCLKNHADENEIFFYFYIFHF
jgi:hypothetical protein